MKLGGGSFRTQKLKKIFNSKKEVQREFGGKMTRKLMTSMAILAEAANLEEAQARRALGLHQLSGNRAKQFAVYLEHPYRLVFQPNHDPIPLKNDGGIDLTQVTAITVIEVVDYHPKR